MPRSRPLHKYPTEYYLLFENAQAKDFTLEFEGPARARYLRSELYNLRSATRAAITLDPDNSPLSEQFLIMENIVIELDNNVLHFRKRKYVNEEHLHRALEGDILDAFKVKP